MVVLGYLTQWIYPAVGVWSKSVLDRAGSHGRLSRTDRRVGFFSQ
jgi:hypothetical protein